MAATASGWADAFLAQRSEDDFAASRAKGANLPGIAAYFAAIDELINSEERNET